MKGSSENLYIKVTQCKRDKLNVVCSGYVTESKSSVTDLGVTLDQFLTSDIIASKILTKSSNQLNNFLIIIIIDFYGAYILRNLSSEAQQNRQERQKL